jgi:hypothetical protein
MCHGVPFPPVAHLQQAKLGRVLLVGHHVHDSLLGCQQAFGSTLHGCEHCKAARAGADSRGGSRKRRFQRFPSNLNTQFNVKLRNESESPATLLYMKLPLTFCASPKPLFCAPARFRVRVVAERRTHAQPSGGGGTPARGLGPTGLGTGELGPCLHEETAVQSPHHTICASVSLLPAAATSPTCLLIHISCFPPAEWRQRCQRQRQPWW